MRRIALVLAVGAVLAASPATALAATPPLTGSFSFENFTNEVVAANVLRRRNPDARAGSRTALEQAFELEAQQRLRDGQKAHAELGRDLTS